jgi:PAS domain S-box-containing protein
MMPRSAREELEKRVKQFEKEVERLRQTEETLRGSEERFRAIATAARDSIMMMDGKGKLSFWNPAAEAMFGYSQQEVMGREVHGLIAPERYHSAFKAAFKTFRKTGKGKAVGNILELTALRKDGTEFPIELSLSSVYFQKGWHAIGIIRDISGRKAVEEERLRVEKLQGGLEVAGAVSHELNQPMQAIYGYAELLLMELPENSRLLETARKIRDQIERMSGITERLTRITSYVTKDYAEGTRIIDIEAAASDEKEGDPLDGPVPPKRARGS